MIKFAKYQGLGNDFIIVDNRHQQELLFTPAQAEKLCDRRFGIGADGVIFLLSGENGCDYTMRILNSDGSEPQMCGNGIRCLARFIKEEIEKESSAVKEYKIWTKAGVITPTVREDELIAVDMGEPVLDPALIPTTLLPETAGVPVLEAPLDIADAHFLVTPVSMGNPHCVIFVDNLDKINPLFERFGPLIEHNEIFPEKANVEFVQVLSPQSVKVKVWERGSGYTLACGTGACASVVAGVLTRRINRSCRVSLPGGDLDITWREADNRVIMTGPAKRSFIGCVDEILFTNE